MDGVYFRIDRMNKNSLNVLVPLVKGARVVRAPRDGLMIYSFSTAQASKVFREVQNSSTSSVYIAGGPHPTGRPGDCLEYFGYVVVGEGEETLPELVDSLSDGDPANVKGVAYRDRGKCIYTGKRPYVDLDRYPPFSREVMMGSIEITRGCPHHCAYCQTPRLFGHRMRHRSPEVVAGYARIIRDVRFISPNAFAYGSNGDRPRPDKIQSLLEAIPENCRIFFGTFPSEVRPEFVTEETLELMKQYCHNTTLSLGGQSGSQAVLDAICRGHMLEDVKHAVSLCREFDLTPIVDIIFGLPDETPDDQHQTLNLIAWIIKMGGRVHSHYFTPLPGTPFEYSTPAAVDQQVNKIMGKLALKGRVTGKWDSF